MEFSLLKNKITKHGIVRYGDDDGHNIYLKPVEVAELDNPDSIRVTITKE